MRIQFILPFIQKTGGILVVLEHARGLQRLGHDVRIFYPLKPYLGLLYEERSWWRRWIYGQAKPFLGNLWRFRRFAPWYPYPVKVTPLPWISPYFLPSADITLATSWVTAYDVVGLKARHGRRFYFIQGYEQWNADPALVDESYRLPISLITIAPWLTELMKKKFGKSTRAEVPNGVDMKIFHPPKSKDTIGPRCILMIYHELRIKGAKEGLAVLHRIHQRFPETRFILFGPTPFPDAPGFATYHLSPSVSEIASFYRQADIFLCPSLNEGWHLPPMEAMASKCAVVATRVGCIPSLDNGANMRVSEPGDVDGLVSHVAELIENPTLCLSIAECGWQTIKEFTWEKSTAKLERALLP